MMRKMQQRSTSAFVNIAGNACAAAISAIRFIDTRDAIDIGATHRRRRKGSSADSESGILAIKKFSRFPRRRLIAARQNPIFGRIAATDSHQHSFDVTGARSSR
jgi:hypothetical protein